MSPKTKLQKSADKVKTLSASPPSSEQPALSSADAQRLEAEICWCIQQLQTALKSGKLTTKQVQDHTKAMNTLMNNTTPLVKKRQVMRLSFGDYRAKMAAEEKKADPANTKIRVSSATPSKNSVFIKKSPFTSSSSDFRFNFKEPTTSTSEDKSKSSEDYATTTTTTTTTTTKANSNFHFAPSDNSFKFNFTVG